MGRPRTAFAFGIALVVISVIQYPITTLAAGPSASSFITITSPKSAGPFDGAVDITGLSTVGRAWIWLRDPARQSQVFPVDCTGGTFKTTLYLRSGPGVYEVLMSHVAGEFDGTVRLRLDNTRQADSRYAEPSVFVDSNNPLVLRQVEALALTGKSDAEKARAIYDWVTRNIAYDVSEYLSGTEEPTRASETLQLGYGTCRDYAILVAALCRAAGLQAKVVYGRATPVRVPIMHAWNEVLVDGKWLSMDATLGAGYVTNWKFVRSPTPKYYDLTSSTHVVQIVAPD